jgi:hypothetical protein
MRFMTSVSGITLRDKIKSEESKETITNGRYGRR